MVEIGLARSFLQEGRDAVLHLRIAGNNVAAGMPQNEGIPEEASKMFGMAARDHEVRLADDVNRGQIVLRFPLI